MSRKHIWYYLKDEEGEPIEGAGINLYLTGTPAEATVYESRTASAAYDQSNILSDDDGYFEFYIGDQFEELPLIGYNPNQFFDLVWDSPGDFDGMVNGIQIFDLVYRVDETDTDAEKNKMVSNALAFSWDRHVDKLYISEPHNLLPLDETDHSDITANKVVNDEVLERLYEFPITSGGLTLETSAALFTTNYLYASAFSPSGVNSAIDFDPQLTNRSTRYPVLQIYETSTGDQIMPIDIIDVDNDLIRVLVVSGTGDMIATVVGEVDV